MQYYKKDLPGCIIYLHNSDECSNCQSSLRSYNIQNDCKEKNTSKQSSVKSMSPLKYLLLETKKLAKHSKFKFPMPIKSPMVKTKEKKEKVIKNAVLSNTNSETVKILPSKKNFKSKKSKKNLTKPIKKKKPAQDRNTKLKKMSCNSDKGSKLPGKGTLKRKRWFLSKLNDKDENHEDDLYENQKFEHFQTLLEDETDNSEKYEELKTPVFPFSISPRQRTPSPTYRDCYSPTQLSICRKGAEEYQYRKKKRQKLLSFETKEAIPQRNVLSREEDIQKRLEEVSRILTIHELKAQKESESEEDEYFSDLCDDSCKVPDA